MKEQLKAGFAYTVEVLDRDGNVVESSVEHNIMPSEGIAHVLNAVFKSGAQASGWYIGLFKGAYTPIAGDTAATFPANATECVDYDASTRLAFTPGAVSGGGLDNAASRAEFVFTKDVTIYGGFISSASAKGGTSGTLISAVRFSSPKSLSAGGVLRVTAGVVLASL